MNIIVLDHHPPKILAKNQSGQAVPHMYDDNDVE